MSPKMEVISHSQYQTEDRFASDLVEQMPILRRAALRMTRHEADAEDLVQETVTRAWERRDQFRPDSNLRAWLLTIQRSLFISACRRREAAWLGSLPDEEEPGRTDAALTTTSAEETLLAGWVDEDLRRALSALPAHYRDAVLLRDVAQRSYAEIGADLACPLGTVMSRLHRGRALLRRLVEQGWAQAGTQQEVPQPCIGACAELPYTAQAA